MSGLQSAGWGGVMPLPTSEDKSEGFYAGFRIEDIVSDEVSTTLLFGESDAYHDLSQQLASIHIRNPNKGVVHVGGNTQIPRSNIEFQIYHYNGSTIKVSESRTPSQSSIEFYNPDLEKRQETMYKLSEVLE